MQERRRKTSPESRPNLFTQLDFHQHYQQHKQRLLSTKYCSPMTRKKPLSFDAHSAKLNTYWKARRTYTKQFQARESSRAKEHNDDIMLRKIISYEDRRRHFSRQEERDSRDNRLHHNSRVFNNKRYSQIDEENPKLYYRITHVSSDYSQKKLKPKTQMMRSFRLSVPPKRYVSSEKVNLNTSMENAQMPQASVRQTQDETFKHSQNQGQQVREKTSNPMFLSTSIRVKTEPQDSNLCERMRRERLAIRLFQRRVRLQGSVVSRLRVVK